MPPKGVFYCSKLVKGGCSLPKDPKDMNPETKQKLDYIIKYFKNYSNLSIK